MNSNAIKHRKKKQVPNKEKVDEVTRVERRSQRKAQLEKQFDIIKDKDLEYIRDKLQLDDYWPDLPDDLVIVAFQDINSEVQTLYPWADREIMEFLGDSTIQFLVVKMFLQISNTLTPGFATQLKSKIVRNSTFECFFTVLGLCRYSKGTKAKGCADSFEALVGIIYKWSEMNDESLTLIEQWLNDIFDLKRIIREVIETNDFPCDIISRLTKSNLAEIKTKIEDPKIKQILRYYQNEFRDGIPDIFMDVNDIVAWDKAISLASRLQIIPFNQWPGLYSDPKIKARLSEIKTHLKEPGYAVNIHSHFYPDYQETSEKEAIRNIKSILRGVEDKDNHFVPEILSLIISDEMFPRLSSVSANSPGEFIQDILAKIPPESYAPVQLHSPL